MSLPIHHVISSGPRPVAPFSHAVEADGFVFVTGQMPTDPAAPDAPLPAGVEAQTRRVFENLKIVLGGVGLGLEHGGRNFGRAEAPAGLSGDVKEQCRWMRLARLRTPERGSPA